MAKTAAKTKKTTKRKTRKKAVQKKPEQVADEAKKVVEESRQTPEQTKAEPTKQPEQTSGKKKKKDKEDESIHAKYERVKKGNLHLTDLQNLDASELHKHAKKEGVSDYMGLSKQELIFKILKERIRQNGLMYGEGVLEVLPDGFGFLRSTNYNYLSSPDDIYVSPSQIRRFAERGCAGCGAASGLLAQPAWSSARTPPRQPSEAFGCTRPARGRWARRPAGRRTACPAPLPRR